MQAVYEQPVAVYEAPVEGRWVVLWYCYLMKHFYESS